MSTERASWDWGAVADALWLEAGYQLRAAAIGLPGCQARSFVLGLCLVIDPCAPLRSIQRGSRFYRRR